MEGMEISGAKPPQIFKIQSKFAFRNESDNEGKYCFLGEKAPK